MAEIVTLEKTSHQVTLENRMRPSIHRRKIIRENFTSPCKLGEIIIVKHYGTMGCWDVHNRWVDFYDSEDFYYNELDKILVTQQNEDKFPSGNYAYTGMQIHSPTKLGILKKTDELH